MNHIRNMKEMLGIPTGSRSCGDKTVSRNVATSGYSTLTDSQLLFGSQFWPENSQGTSQSSRNSQQSSQEGSDPKFSSTYHTKPLLFGDKSRTSGLLDKFEEDKKKAKEKNDSDLLAKECQHIRETLSNIQQEVAGTERNTAVCQTLLEQFASTWQNNWNSLQKDISQQFETLVNKMKSQEDVLTNLEEKVQKSGDATAELGSHLQSLTNSLKCKSKVQDMFEEALKLPNTSVSEHSARPSTGRVMDSAIQTSPRLEQSAYNILQDNKLKGTQLTCASYNLEQNLVEVPPQDHFRIIGKKKFKQSGYSRRKKRPLVFSQRRKGAVSDENSQPLVNRNKQQTPLCERRDLNAVTNQGLNPDCMKRETKSSAAAGCLITPVSWSQDSSSSVCLSGIDPILEKLSAESNAGTLVKPEGLWQLFDSDFDF